MVKAVDMTKQINSLILLKVPSEPKTEKGYISLGMANKMSKKISFFELTNERWVNEKFSTNEELHNPTPIPRDMYPFSVFGSEKG